MKFIEVPKEFVPMQTPEPRSPPEPMVAPKKPRAEVFRDAVLWILIVALALASLTFLISVNSIISIWFRDQWAPVARAVAALAVIVACVYGLGRIVWRPAPH